MKHNGANTFGDRQIVCCDCGEEFTFSRGEQEYFLSKMLSDPRRCLDCRRARRARIVPDQAVNLDR
jgi:hypothetical protein